MAKPTFCAIAVAIVMGAGANLCFHTAAPAEIIQLTCRVTSTDASNFIRMGRSDFAQTVENVTIDTSTLKAGVWGTYPGDEHPQGHPTRYYYSVVTAEYTKWTIPPEEDDPDEAPVYEAYDRNTKVFTINNPDNPNAFGGSLRSFGCVQS